MSKLPAVDQTLGHRIRARRRSIGMTQADLASSLGVSFQQVQKYEKGLNSISERRLLQICEIMKLPPEFFTSGDNGYIGKPVPAAPVAVGSRLDPAVVERFVTSGEGQRLIEAFLGVTDHRLRTRILDFIASVATDQSA